MQLPALTLVIAVAELVLADEFAIQQRIYPVAETHGVNLPLDDCGAQYGIKRGKRLPHGALCDTATSALTTNAVRRLMVGLTWSEGHLLIASSQ